MNKKEIIKPNCPKCGKTMGLVSTGSMVRTFYCGGCGETKPATTLKDLLKKHLVLEMDSSGIALFSGVEPVLFADFREGWDNPLVVDKKLQIEFRDFMRYALNEKQERDYGEPMRWIRKRATYGDVWVYECPKCQTESGSIHNFCPSCGQRLLSPGEKEE